MEKLLVIIIVILVLGGGITISVLSFQKLSLTKDIAELNTELARANAETSKAILAFDTQKQIIQQLELDKDAALAVYTSSIDQIKRKYEDLLKNSNIDSSNPIEQITAIKSIYKEFYHD